MENFILPGTALSGIYTYMWRTFLPGEYIEEFTDSIKKENGRLGKLDIDMLDSSMTKEMATDLKTKGKKPGYTSRLRG